MQNELDKAMESKIRAVKGRYLKTLQGHTDQLKKLLILCQKNKLTTEERTELLSNAHHLAGNGAIFGFTEVSEFGMSLQDALRDNPNAKADFFVEQLSSLIKACDEALSSDNSEQNQTEGTINNIDEKHPPELPVVLVIDDDDNIQGVIFELLKDYANVITCKDTVEIIELIRKYQPSIILLDNQLPGGVFGLDILEKIQSLHDINNTPVIMLTASNTPEKVLKGLMSGAVDYITKPFDPQKLVKKIRERLELLHNQILIADDDEAIRELLRHKFTNAGCRVTCVADGAKAWDAMQKNPFSLIILDYMMPGFDGMTILRMMKENSKLDDVPVVFLTAKHSSSDVMEGLNTGAADYICKPFNSDELIIRCVRLIKQPR